MAKQEIGTFDVVDFAGSIAKDAEVIKNFGRLERVLKVGAERSAREGVPLSEFMLSGYVDYMNNGGRVGLMVNFVLRTERGVEFESLSDDGITGYMSRVTRRTQKITLFKSA